MSDGDPVTESAKAVQEISKVTGKGIDALKGIGNFAALYVRGSVEIVSAMIQRELQYVFWERGVRLIEKAEEFAKAHGIEMMPDQIPLNLAVDILREGSMEEDDELQDRYAALLANAVDGNATNPTKRMHVIMLNQMGPLEVRVLDILFASPGPGPQFDDLSGEYIDPPKIEHDKINDREFFTMHPTPTNDLQIALENLMRLGCVRNTVSFMHGIDIRNRVYLTKLGRNFMEACKLKNPL